MVDGGDNLKKNSSSQIKAEDQVNKANVLPLINSLNVSIQGNDDTVFRRQSNGLLAKNSLDSFKKMTHIIRRAMTLLLLCMRVVFGMVHILQSHK